MARTPFYLYVLNTTQVSASDSYAARTIRPSEYLLNKTTADTYYKADGQLYVYINVADIPQTLPTVRFGEYIVNQQDYSVKLNTGQILYIRQASSSVTVQSLARPRFEFYVSPQHITPTYRKLQTETRTRGGWEVQHWGDALTEVRVTGKTGGLHTMPAGETDITKSLAWQALTELRSIYQESNSVKNVVSTTSLGMQYFDRFFIGYFSEFTGPEADAEKPYLMDYSFSFKVQTEVSKDSVSAFLR